MHLEELLMLCNGPTEKASLALPFHTDGRPKPVVIVGGNGTGKTNLLSSVADAMMEIAVTQYRDVLPPLSAGHSYYRVLGGRTTRIGSTYSLTAFKFKHSGQFAYYRSTTGAVPFDALQNDLQAFGSLNAANKSAESKTVDVPADLVKATFKNGAYVYFPSSRHELPHWLNDLTLDADPAPRILPNYGDKLGKPMVLDRGMGLLKPWLIDVILDQSISVTTLLLMAKNKIQSTAELVRAVPHLQTFADVNQLLQIILTKNDAHIVRAPRAMLDRRLQIQFGSNPGLPTLDSMSAGQGGLFNIFGGTLMLGTLQQTVATAATTTGIVLVDEIDAHLHADLQYEALPRLMAMFPLVQFIVTSHSPLLPLGMQRQFGDDGYVLLEMPNALPISTERYSEFLRSFEMYQSTRTFEDKLKSFAAAGKPVIIGEGDTDPLYLSTAAELLGYTDLIEGLEFRHIGELAGNGRRTRGQDQLKKAADIYKVSIPLLGRRVACIFDQKSKEQIKITDHIGEKLAILSLPLVNDHPHCNDGPENLIPPELFCDNFYDEQRKLVGATKTTTRTLNKTKFAEHICSNLRNPQHFVLFRPILDELRAFLNFPTNLKTNP